MSLNQWMDESLPSVVRALKASVKCPVASNTERGLNLAGQKAVHDIVERFMSILFPGCHGAAPVVEGRMDVLLNITLREVAISLAEQTENALRYQCDFEECANCNDCREKSYQAVTSLIESIPEVRNTLLCDVQAAFDGDPAARSFMEIVMSYPGVYAVAVHRVAHVLYNAGVPLIPRVMSEFAHSRTGIDIHPGATIGAGFFIDHGTGVVIGETCIIGKNVKIYQGVTLGALSFPKDEHGNPIKGIKRHPEVRDNVTIYAGATILGGDTVVGEDSVIGGNVWLTHSVPPHTKVYNQQPQPRISTANSVEK